MMIIIKKLVGDHFCEDAYGRNGYGHVFKSKKMIQKIFKKHALMKYQGMFLKTSQGFLKILTHDISL
jgi:hypothetical protein